MGLDPNLVTVDVAKSAGMSMQGRGLISTMTTNSKFYSFGLHRLLHGLDLLALHGFEPRKLSLSGHEPAALFRLLAGLDLHVSFCIRLHVVLLSSRSLGVRLFFVCIHFSFCLVASSHLGMKSLWLVVDHLCST